MANPHLIIFSFFLNFKEATRKIIYPKQLIPSFLSDLRRLKKKKEASSELNMCSQTFSSIQSILGTLDFLFSHQQQGTLKSDYFWLVTHFLDLTK